MLNSLEELPGLLRIGDGGHPLGYRSMGDYVGPPGRADYLQP